MCVIAARVLVVRRSAGSTKKLTGISIDFAGLQHLLGEAEALSLLK